MAGNKRPAITGTVKLTKWDGSVLSGSTFTTALTMPSAVKDAPGTDVTTGLLGIDTQGRGRLDLTFGGTGAGGTINYQVIGYRHSQANSANGFIPEKIAAGTVTLGTQTFGAEGAYIEGSASLWADTITETLASGFASVYSPADNTMARLSIDVSPFIYATVQVERGTANTANVVANLADWIGGMSTFDADVAIGDVDLTAGGNAMTRLGTNADAASVIGSQAAQLRSIGLAVGGEETLYEYFSVAINQAVDTNATIKAGEGSKQIWVYGWLVHAGVAAGTYQWLSAANTRTGECPVGVNGGAVPTTDRGSGPIFKCVTAEDLKLITVTCTIDGVIWGYVVTV